MAERKQVDWEAVERDYRAGILSLREIAAPHDVTEGAIRKRAKVHGWERDLTAKVQEKVRNELVRSEVRSAHHANPQAEREIVEHAAATVVQVVRSHRKAISQGQALVELLTKQLTDVAGRRDEFEGAIEIECADEDNGRRRSTLMKAVSLATHASVAVNLSNAAKTWIGLERQAFSIKDETGADDGITPADKADVSAEEAYRRMVERG